MEPLFLSGEYDLTLDEKFRLMIPAGFRKKINPVLHGEDYYLVVQPNRTLWIYPQLYYEWIKARTPVAAIPKRSQADQDRLDFSMGGGIAEADKAGRVVIPDRVRKRIGLERDVTVIGARDRIEIWNRDVWAEYSEALLNRGDEINDAARQEGLPG